MGLRLQRRRGQYHGAVAQTMELINQGMTAKEAAARLGISPSRVRDRIRSWKTARGLPTGLRPNKGRKEVTPILQQVIDLCDGTRTLNDMAAILGISRAMVGDRVGRAQEVLGRKLSYPRQRTTRQYTDEEKARQREIDRALAEAPTCACGLRVFPSKVAEHQCPPCSVVDFVSSHTSNLGQAQNLPRPL